MNPLRHIRVEVLGLKQAEMAALAGVSQGTVSKWETGIAEPSRAEMQRIREAAVSKGKRWRDEWFFAVQPGAAA